ncbi:hypothetical protein [Streptomyces chromofuscus]|uniref:Integral membrane protein n=1 Tax=Streptomyces chromofuscus TaxID=42881 RepID=A0A7M2T3P5_STRCW|nr:hypothetical protein [Streptomyces chromofuscus]QOV42503.1 hypothetical protein IPT68_22050 [Streptomyces chromofuscus]GGT31067.1 hypothetical protein GCM10010254_59560 [Streptomyces chromofuscus]
MPDRSLRLLTLPPQSVQGRKRSGVLLRERPASSSDASSGNAGGGQQGGPGQDDNPFAPPPEGTPDRPWQPRRPSGDSEDSGGSGGSDGSRGDGGRPTWGSQWSDRQPGRSSGGGFGDRPGGNPERPGGPTPGMRWDPTDPAQRRARYALLAGMWAFFFALFSWTYVALLLGALALYWGVSALRAKPRTPSPDARAGATPARPQTAAAVSGLVTASLAIALVGASFAAQMVYRDYYTCTTDALTNEARQACSELLPEQLRKVLGANA